MCCRGSSCCSRSPSQQEAWIACIAISQISKRDFSPRKTPADSNGKATERIVLPPWLLLATSRAARYAEAKRWSRCCSVGAAAFLTRFSLYTGPTAWIIHSTAFRSTKPKLLVILACPVGQPPSCFLASFSFHPPILFTCSSRPKPATQPSLAALTMAAAPRSEPDVPLNSRTEPWQMCSVVTPFGKGTEATALRPQSGVGTKT
mmetsp:Transcript_27585/g.76409  ORF Transcript_27585/g.76409 Transcript_27585/m.76409 type:complete len:204 (-) Transcript_27585:18-629(-)